MSQDEQHNLSRRPYFLRAMHEWIVDSGDTPHIVVDAYAPNVQIPRGYDNDGKLVMNVSPVATQNLSLGNDFVAFKARFAGAAHEVMVPVTAVLAIYARETGQGIVFSPEDEAQSPPSEAESESDDKPEPPSDNRPHLRVVK